MRLTDVGGGPWSNEVSVTTPANAPHAPAAPKDARQRRRTGGDADTIKITWEAPADDGGADITSYELQVRTVDADFMTTWTTARCRISSGNSLITNLPEDPHSMHSTTA